MTRICLCGEEVPHKRALLGYTTCLPCGERAAKKRRFTIAPMHKGNYIVISNLDDLKGLNNKGGNVRF